MISDMFTARRVHTDEMKFCENNCGAFGQLGKRLMKCTGCHLAYYCVSYMSVARKT